MCMWSVCMHILVIVIFRQGNPLDHENWGGGALITDLGKYLLILCIQGDEIFALYPSNTEHKYCTDSLLENYS